MKGRAAFHRKLARLPKAVESEVVGVIAKEAAALVRAIEPQVPRRPGSGVLAASVGWTWGDAPAGGISIGTFRGNTFGQIKASIFAGVPAASKGDPDPFYGRFVEFGTEHSAAQPFFFPTFRANRRRIRAAVSRAVTRGAKKANTGV